MIKILIMINITLSLMMTAMNHPLSMGFILLLQTTTISLITGNLNSNFWFSYILFLIMIGGMLILFMYMTSIASNEKFKFNKNILIAIPLSSMIMLFLTQTENFTINNEMMETEKFLSLSTSLNKFVNFPLTMIMLFMMIYLLLALIATVKITNFKQGSIRQMN